MESKKRIKKHNFRKYIVAFWSFFIISIAFVLLLFALIANGKLGEMPSFEELENPRNLVASEVISRDGEVLGRYFKENRTVASYEELPESLVNALVATEDARYYNHSGIDLRGLFRVVKGLVTVDRSSGGGSTISQQLAKMLFPRNPKASKVELVLRKLKEWVIAVKLEKRYTKEEIIAMYLNKYDFLNLAVGINSASRIYFSCEPKDLTIEQSAMLVGMAKNSSLFNPLRRLELTEGRRNVVLNQMVKYGFLEQGVCDSLVQIPLDLKFNREDFKLGLAPYFREHLRLTLSAQKPLRENYADWQYNSYRADSIAWETDPAYGWCNKNQKEDGSNYNIYTDGLRIYTTIDARMQQYAEEAVTEHLSTDLQPSFSHYAKNLRNAPFPNDLSKTKVESILAQCMKQSERYRVLKNVQNKSKKEIEKIFSTPTEMTVFSWGGDIDTIMSPIDSIQYTLSFLRSAMMSIDTETGQIRAYVGGPNYQHFMYDMVTKGKRQAGSTVKPFLYALAMQNGYSPCEKVPNVPQQFVLPDGKTWSPKNSGKTEYDGQMVTLKWGLSHSVNYISAWIMKQFNPEAMKNMMQRLGISSSIEAVPSMFLGTADIPVYEMAGAYATFVNRGVYTKPYFVTRISDKHGNTITTFAPEQRDAIDERTAYLMTELLQSVVKEGSGGRLRWHKEYGGLKSPIGGKTGTTQSHSDGWFMGITPQLSTAVWTGGEVRTVRFASISHGQGANMALPIFGRFLNKVHADPTLEYKPDVNFYEPEGINVNIDCPSEDAPSEEDDNDDINFDDFF